MFPTWVVLTSNTNYFRMATRTTSTIFSFLVAKGRSRATSTRRRKMWKAGSGTSFRASARLSTRPSRASRVTSSSSTEIESSSQLQIGLLVRQLKLFTWQIIFVEWKCNETAYVYGSLIFLKVKMNLKFVLRQFLRARRLTRRGQFQQNYRRRQNTGKKDRWTW